MGSRFGADMRRVCASGASRLSDDRDMERSSELRLAMPTQNGSSLLHEEALERLSHGMLVIVDSDLRVVLAEGLGLAQDGVRKASVRGRRLDDVVAPGMLEALLGQLQAVLG